jgi:hypothetical protein
LGEILQSAAFVQFDIDTHRAIRANVFSRPKNSKLSKIGGLTAVPLTATRIGWATLPNPNPLVSQ